MISKGGLSRGNAICKGVLLTGTAMAAVLYVGAALAQQQPQQQASALPQSQLQTVVVTAQRTQQSEQNVPMDVVALPQQTIQNEGITSSQQLTNLIPNMTVGTTSAIAGLNSGVTIRGVPEVGLYVDGIWQPSNGFKEGDLVQVQRVEVLYGPQGTLFGRNTNGGAINYITVLPSATFGVHGSIDIGTFNRRFVNASVDVPFGDSVLTKWTAADDDQGGWAKSILTNEWYGGNDNKVFRGDVLWKPTNAFSLRLTGQDSTSVGSVDYVSRIYPGLENQNNITAVVYNVATMNPAYGPYTWYTGSTEWLDRFIYGNHLDPQHSSWGFSNNVGDTPPGAYDPRYCPSGCTGTGAVGKWENTMTQSPDADQFRTKQFSATATWNITPNMTITDLASFIEQDIYQFQPVNEGPELVMPMERRFKDRYYQDELHLTGNLFHNKVNYLLGLYWLRQHTVDRTVAWGMNQFYVATDPTNPVLDNGNDLTLDPVLLNFLHQWGLHMAGTPIGDTIDRCVVNCNEPPFVGTSETYAQDMATWGPNWPYFGEQAASGPNRATIADNTSDDYSVFGNATWHLLSALDLQGGLRLSWINGVNQTYLPTGAFETVRPPELCGCLGYGPGSQTAEGALVHTTHPYPSGKYTLTPMATATYHWTPSINTYVRYAQGYTSPSTEYNATVNTTYDLAPEVVSDYEAGLRADWLNHRLRTNFTPFLLKWTGQRVTEFVAVPGVGLTTFTAAAGASQAYGFEAAVNALLYRGLQVSATLSNLNTKFLNVGNSNIAANAHWPYSPEWMWHLAGQYDFLLPSQSSITFRADYAHVSAYVEAADPAVSHGIDSAYGLLNARIIYTPQNANWNVALYGTNLTDVAYVTNGQGGNTDAGIDSATLGQRREVGVRFGFDFQ